MKRMGKNICFLICLVGICGCGDFLEEVSQNEMRPVLRMIYNSYSWGKYILRGIVRMFFIYISI